MQRGGAWLNETESAVDLLGREGHEREQRTGIDPTVLPPVSVVAAALVALGKDGLFDGNLLTGEVLLQLGTSFTVGYMFKTLQRVTFRLVLRLHL